MSVERKEHKWARQQATEFANKNFHDRQEGQYEMNLYTGQYYKSRQDLTDERNVRIDTVCRPSTDCGRTKANPDSSMFCLLFARGQCALGADCTYLHRLPTLTDYRSIGVPTDCFGRARKAKYSDNMNGVGSFLYENKTLFVTGMRLIPPKPSEQTVSTPQTQAEKALAVYATRYYNAPRRSSQPSEPGKRRPPSEQQKAQEQWVMWRLHNIFAPFGRVQAISVKLRINCAFVTFENRLTAEFVKEALERRDLSMISVEGDTATCQDNSGEILNIRWARQDPDPRAQKRDLFLHQQQLIRTLLSQGAVSADDIDSATREYYEIEALPTQSTDEQTVTVAEVTPEGGIVRGGEGSAGDGNVTGVKRGREETAEHSSVDTSNHNDLKRVKTGSMVGPMRPKPAVENSSSSSSSEAHLQGGSDRAKLDAGWYRYYLQMYGDPTVAWQAYAEMARQYGVEVTPITGESTAVTDTTVESGASGAVGAYAADGSVVVSQSAQQEQWNALSGVLDQIDAQKSKKS